MESTPLIDTIFFVAPGRVSEVQTEAAFTSLRVSWQPPLEPNGVILDYEASYRFGRSPPIKVGVSSDRSIVIPELTPGTRVEVTVFAVNSAGSGKATTQYLRTEHIPREKTIILLAGNVHRTNGGRWKA